MVSSLAIFWGVSASAYQTEGYNRNQWTDWERKYAEKRAAKSKHKSGRSDNRRCVNAEAKNPDNYVSGALADHYHRYKEDFDLAKKMNMNALRFSIEWSRIEPQEGVWNAEAITHYKDYIDELNRRGMEPIITLFHFTLPVWFARKGGFEKRSNIKYFERFCQRVTKELCFGKYVKYIITINEPEVYVTETYMGKNWPNSVRNPMKMWRAINNLCLAHNLVADAIHTTNPGCKVSIAKQPVFFSGSGSDDNFITRLVIKAAQYVQNDWILDKVVKHCDFLGINYYMSMKVDGFRISKSCSAGLSDLNWGLSPADIQFVLERMSNKYSLPIMVTENGLADAEDKNRQWWITQTIAAMRKSVDNGVDLLGYLHWSLIDNFEWSYGKWPRFGLVAIDYTTGERKLRPSARWFGKFIRQQMEKDTPTA